MIKKVFKGNDILMSKGAIIPRLKKTKTIIELVQRNNRFILD